MPFYVQVAEHIKNMIRYGYYPVGKRISVRKVSDEFGVSKSVAENALDMLKSENIVETHHKSGTYISKDALNNILQNTPDWQKLSDKGAYQPNREVMKQTSIRGADRSAINLGYYNYDEPYFHPYEALEYAMKSMLEMDYAGMFSCGDYLGLPELRAEVAKHCLRYGIKTTPDNVLIFNVWYQAMNAISHAFLTHGANVFMSEYDVMNSMRTVSTLGSNINYINCDPDGIIPEDLDKKLSLKRTGVMYINPVNHWPTGATFNESRRAETLEIIRKHKLPVVEMDLLRDLWIDEPPMPLKSDDNDGQIIYVGAMSNLFNVGSRSAWVVAPDPVVERLMDVKLQLYGALSHLVEILTWQMLKSGAYVRNMERMRELLPARIDSLDRIFRDYLGGMASWEKKNLLYYSWIKFGRGINTDKVFLDCRDVFFQTGSLFNDREHSHILISSNSESLENIELGVAAIAASAKKQIS